MVKPPHKMTKLVVSAIRNLRDVQGSTTKDILNYVMREYNSEPSMERRLRAALKRGIQYGILQKKGPHYLLNDTEILTDQGPMERSRRRRRRRRRGGRRKSGKKGRSRRRRRGARRRAKSRVRKAKRQRRRGARHHHARGKTMRKRGGGVDDMEMLAKEPLEAAGPRTGVDTIIGPTYDRPRSRSRSRQSRQSRSRTPSHSRSSGSSDREAADGRRQAD